MKLFKRNCKLCGEPTRLFNAYKIKLQTEEGILTMRICDECAKTLEAFRHLKSGKEMKEDDDAFSL